MNIVTWFDCETVGPGYCYYKGRLIIYTGQDADGHYWLWVTDAVDGSILGYSPYCVDWLLDG